MKVKVLIPFKDKETKKVHKKGDVIDITVKRVNEITANKYIQIVEEKEPAKE